MDDVKERFYRDFDTFNKASHEYEQEEITAKEYKSVSTGFGEYLQRDNHQMLRIRIPGGRLSVKDMETILYCCQYYGIETVKLTTGQAIQLHDLDPHAGRRLILRLLDQGIVTRGAGGDNPNNVTASPLSGVNAADFFDVMPYAAACDSYILRYTGIEPLPRKFKMGFCSSGNNDTHVTIKDLGFMANPDGTFDVYAAGGMGVKPRTGLLVGSHIDPSKVLYYLRAMLDVYIENGDYKNRFKARTRFLQDTMGTDGFLAAFKARLSEVMSEEKLDIHPEPVIFRKMSSSRLSGPLADDPRIFHQKEEGLYAVPYHPIGGYISMRKMEEIDRMIQSWEEVEMRLAPDGGLYVINLTAEEVENLLPLFQDGAQTTFEASVACVGRARCAIGAADSQALLRDCIRAVRLAGLPDGFLPGISISGCISSCGETQIGTMGFRGGRKKKEDGTFYEVYFISLGGSAVPGHEVLASGTKALPADRIPAFIVELGHLLVDAGTPFAVWYPDHAEELETMIDSYAV
ncbi:MAG: nitrite/sulfite reductase [Lachnospiraceae bacterium]|nr:nitrite/sulfite reductase [Lachnospiraceae bacterium]